MVTYLTFQKRMRVFTRQVTSKKISVEQYIDGFDAVLKSIGWSEQKLLEQIDMHW